jgi:hypothetical protein
MLLEDIDSVALDTALLPKIFAVLTPVLKLTNVIRGVR